VVEDEILYGISHQITELKSPLKSADNGLSLLTATDKGRMLRKEDFMVIQALARCGLYLCDIAKQVEVQPRTVRRALTRARSHFKTFGPYELVVSGRRTRHIRFNDLNDSKPIPHKTDFAGLLESDVPIVVQHTRRDSRQA